MLDARPYTASVRHQKIFAAYAKLQPGEKFLLVNDHDPKPLHYQLIAENAGDVTWDVLESGPEVWRVEIGRPVSKDH